MTIPFDLAVHFALGAVAGLYASRVVGSDGAFVNRFLVALIAAVAVLFVPLAIVRFKFWNDWSWLYAFDPADFPAKAKLPAEAAVVSLLFLSSLAGYRISLRAGNWRAQLVAIGGPIVIAIGGAALLSHRLYTIGGFGEFVSGVGKPLNDSPWMWMMFTAEVTSIIATVAIVRRLAQAPNRGLSILGAAAR